MFITCYDVHANNCLASIIGSWWAFSFVLPLLQQQILSHVCFNRCSRWFDHWISTCTAMRLCISLGFNLEDTLEKPLAPHISDHMLIGPPQSYLEVELRRNLFWLSYCAERYHLFAGHWRECNFLSETYTCSLTYNHCWIAFTINDEDIRQTLPGTLDAFETGVS